jgi:hypothetical protein
MTNLCSYRASRPKIQSSLILSTTIKSCRRLSPSIKISRVTIPLVFSWVLSIPYKLTGASATKFLIPFVNLGKNFVLIILLPAPLSNRARNFSSPTCRFSWGALCFLLSLTSLTYCRVFFGQGPPFWRFCPTLQTVGLSFPDQKGVGLRHSDRVGHTSEKHLRYVQGIREQGDLAAYI